LGSKKIKRRGLRRAGKTDPKAIVVVSKKGEQGGKKRPVLTGKWQDPLRLGEKRERKCEKVVKKGHPYNNRQRHLNPKGRLPQVYPILES